MTETKIAVILLKTNYFFYFDKKQIQTITIRTPLIE